MSARAPGKGIALACTDAGGAGRPVLFVHGFGHNRVVWEAVTAGLDPRLRAIAVDLRGHGASDWSPEGHYHPADYALDLPATLDALGIERAALVAHSLGGNAATLFAAELPERVESLVLVDTGPALAAAATAHIARDVGAALVAYDSQAAFRARLAAMHPLADGDALARLGEASLVRRLDGRYEARLDPGVLADGVADVDLAAIEAQLWEALGRLPCPTLVVRGGRSAVLPEPTARRMVDEVLAAGSLVTLERAGHGVMLDEPAGLRLALEGFLLAGALS